MVQVSCSSETKTIWPVEPDWSAYIKNTLEIEEPWPTLVQALKYFAEEQSMPGIAIDLGCGAGRDTLFLLNNNWQVFAIDATQDAIDVLLSRVFQEKLAFLTASVSTFADMKFPKQIKLINANRSLPFCNSREFSDLWEEITDHLVIGGRFSGQFFGDRDEWASISGRTHHTYQQMLNLFQDHFEIEYLLKEESSFPTASGKMKYWHIFSVVARKIC